MAVTVARGAGSRVADTLGLAPRPAYIVDRVDQETEPPLEVGDEIVRVGWRKQGVDELVADDAIYLYAPPENLAHFLAQAGRVYVLRGEEEVKVTYEAHTRLVGQIGVEPTPAATVRQESLLGSVVPALRDTVSMGTFAFKVLGKLIAGEISIRQLMGPVGIIQHTYLSVKRGFSHFLWLVHLITVNIGVFNLLPLPPLDGGRIVMVAYEKVRGRQPSRRLQEAVLLAGVAVVLLIFVYATFNDVRRLIFGS
jgi:regulator of sigma E protease